MNAAYVHAGFLLVAVALPLLMAAGLANRGWRAGLAQLAPWAALPALVAVFVVPKGTEAAFAWLFLGSTIGLDQTGQVFLFFSAALWWLCGLFAQSYLAGDAQRARFFTFYLLAMAGNFGLILARDMVTFYVSFSLMSFSAYGLVIHNGDRDALRAGRIYLCLVVLGELMLFAALAMIAARAGSLLLREAATVPMNSLTLAFLLLGFGIKVGALPLHGWLPLAHPAAPVPASAVLSGAMIKAGLLGWMRFLPLGQAGLEGWGAAVIGAGLAAAFYGVLVGVTQSNPKTVLAYSSISQMGLITIPVGIGLMVPSLWPAAAIAILIYALHHAFAKSALFLGVGLASRVETQRQRAWMFLGLCVPALALVGAPYTSGAIAKAAIKTKVESLPAPWSALLEWVLPLAAVGTTLLMARLLWLIWTKPAPHGHPRAGLWISWGLLLLAVVSVAWVVPLADPAEREAIKLAKVWLGLWPFALGALVALALLVLSRNAKLFTVPRIPAGDFLVGIEHLLSACRRAFTLRSKTPRTSESPATPAFRPIRVGLSQALAKADRTLRFWATVGAMLLLIIVVISWLTAGFGR